MARQLPAFAGLRALRHLDLQIVGVDQIFRGHAEAARRHLLDRRAHRIAVRHRHVTIRLLAALAGVRLAADPVHRDRQCRVRLTRDRAEAHRAGGETMHDGRGGFDFLDRHRFGGGVERHQAAQGQQPLALVVDRAGEFLEAGIGIAAHRMLQPANGFRRPGMRFAAQAELVIAADVQHRAVQRAVAIGVAMPRHRFLGDFLVADALDRRGRCR